MKITTSRLDLPFIGEVAHTQKIRSRSDSILVKAEEDGISGYGEAIPRDYVSGENQETATKFIKSLQVSSVNSISALEGFVSGSERQIDLNPAAWCGVELAILDLLGKKHALPLEELLRLPKPDLQYRYSAVIPRAGEKDLSFMISQALACKIRDFKFKVTGQETASYFDTIRTLSQQPGILVRADANNLWDSVPEVLDWLKWADIDWYGLEEPLNFWGNKNYWHEIRQLSQKAKPYIILDDSFRRKEDLEEISDKRRFIFNIRLGKSGGLIRSLELCRRLRGQKMIIGCHVGETSLMTRASLALSHANITNIVAREGAFSTYLLKEDPFYPNLKFGAGGILETREARIAEPGLGLSYAP